MAWTEPSPAMELAEKIRKLLEESRLSSIDFSEDIEKFNKQGWDKSEEIHQKKVELFEKLKKKDLPPSEYANIMNEINKLS